MAGKTQTGVEGKMSSDSGRELALDIDKTTALVTAGVWVLSLASLVLRLLRWAGVIHLHLRPATFAEAASKLSWNQVLYVVLIPVLIPALFILFSRAAPGWFRVLAAVTSLESVLVILQHWAAIPAHYRNDELVKGLLDGIAFAGVLVGIPIWFRSKIRYV
jgi:hypothetical protein